MKWGSSEPISCLLTAAATLPRPPSWPARAGLVLLATLLGVLAVLGVVDMVGAVLGAL